MKNRSLLKYGGGGTKECKHLMVCFTTFAVVGTHFVSSKIFRNFPSVLTLPAFLTGQGYIFHQFFDDGLLVRKKGDALVLVFDHFLVD